VKEHNMPASPSPGEPVTVILSGVVDASYNRDGPMIAVRVDGAFAYIPASDAPGVALFPGARVLPVILDALETALQFWEPAAEIEDCGECGDGVLCDEHAADRVKADRFRDVLKQLGGGE
jgi:hypothetical protein